MQLESPLLLVASCYPSLQARESSRPWLEHSALHSVSKQPLQLAAQLSQLALVPPTSHRKTLGVKNTHFWGILRDCYMKKCSHGPMNTLHSITSLFLATQLVQRLRPGGERGQPKKPFLSQLLPSI